MKKILLILSVITILSCNSSKEKKSLDANSTAITSKSDDLETVILNDTVPYEESVMLLGKANRRGLQMDAFKDWFAPGYESYTPNPQIIERLKPLMEDVEITLFMGTWCEDSHRDVPHLYRILDDLNFDESNLDVYAVSEEKTTPEGYEDGKNIIQVPTIIFYKDGKELGRIVEYSIYTVEQDMLDILSGKDYKNPYSE